MPPACNRSAWRVWRTACGRCIGHLARAALLGAFLFAPVLAAENESPTPAEKEPAGAAGNEAAKAENEPAAAAGNEAPTPAESESAAVGEPVIPPGHEELLAAMLGKGATLPDDCKLAGAEVDHTIIKATYTCPGGEVVFKLTHLSQASDTAKQTARFAISVLSGSPPASLAPALEALIRSREAGFEWMILKPAPTIPAAILAVNPAANPAAATRSPLMGVVLTVAGLSGIVALVAVLRRRTSARPTQLP